MWSRTGALTTTPSTILLPNGWTELKLLVDAQSYGQLGSAYTAPGVATVNGVTTISSGGGATGGTFKILVLPRPATAYDGGNGYAAITAAIPYNETAANIKTALVNTGYFTSAGITAAGGALPTAVTLTWTNSYAGTVPQLAVQSSLTGGNNAAIRLATTTTPSGNGGYGYLEANAQEVWIADPNGSSTDRYLYLASVGASANYYITAYR